MSHKFFDHHVAEPCSRSALEGRHSTRLARELVAELDPGLVVALVRGTTRLGELLPGHQPEGRGVPGDRRQPPEGATEGGRSTSEPSGASGAFSAL